MRIIDRCSLIASVLLQEGIVSLSFGLMMPTLASLYLNFQLVLGLSLSDVELIIRLLSSLKLWLNFLIQIALIDV